MTILEWRDYFDILQDKYGSPYFTDDEKTLLFNRAQIEFVKSYLPDDETAAVNIELSQDTINDIEPLIYTFPYLSMNSSGVVSKSTLSTSLTSLVADGVLWRPLSIGWVLGTIRRPVKYVRHNDWWEFQSNFFKKPSSDNPKCRVDGTNYIFEPINSSARLYFTVLKYPREVDIDTTTSSDLPDHTHDKIISIALELAGVSSRDEALAQLLQIKKA